MVDKILELPKKCTIYLLSPIVRGRKGEYKKEILNYKKRGFQKIKVDGTLYDIDEVQIGRASVQGKSVDLGGRRIMKKKTNRHSEV